MSHVYRLGLQGMTAKILMGICFVRCRHSSATVLSIADAVAYTYSLFPVTVFTVLPLGLWAVTSPSDTSSMCKLRART